eukprot:ctg_1028.g423
MTRAPLPGGSHRPSRDGDRAHPSRRARSEAQASAMTDSATEAARRLHQRCYRGDLSAVSSAPLRAFYERQNALLEAFAAVPPADLYWTATPGKRSSETANDITEGHNATCHPVVGPAAEHSAGRRGATGTTCHHPLQCRQRAIAAGASVRLLPHWEFGAAGQHRRRRAGFPIGADCGRHLVPPSSCRRVAHPVRLSGGTRSPRIGGRAGHGGADDRSDAECAAGVEHRVDGLRTTGRPGCRAGHCAHADRASAHCHRTELQTAAVPSVSDVTTRRRGGAGHRPPQRLHLQRGRIECRRDLAMVAAAGPARWYRFQRVHPEELVEYHLHPFGPPHLALGIVRAI